MNNEKKYLISFSLWGTNPKYLVGAIKNAEIAQKLFKDWKLRYYVSLEVPSPVILNLQKFDNVEIVRTNVFGDWNSLFYRHFPAEEDFDVVLFRDCDSRLSEREKSAINMYILNKEKQVLILKDHPYHKCSICMPGLLGFKDGFGKGIKKDIQNFQKGDYYGVDYKFFDEWLKKNVDFSKIMLYDEFYGGLKFPMERKGLKFVGEVFDENDMPNLEHRKILADWLKNR